MKRKSKMRRKKRGKGGGTHFQLGKRGKKTQEGGRERGRGKRRGTLKAVRFVGGRKEKEKVKERGKGEGVDAQCE